MFSAIKLINGENAMKSTKSNIGIYVDLQNVLSIEKPPQSLLDLAKSKGDLICKNAYYNSQSQNQNAAIKKLKSVGFDCVDVPCSVKNSADNQLKSDVIDAIYSPRSPDIVILVSGDGDFANLMRLLKERNKKTIVFARRGNIKKQLKDLADEIYFIEDLAELVEKKNKQAATKNSQSKISWEKAVNCLVEAIKLSQKGNKGTTLSCIGQQIRNSACFSKNKKLEVWKKDGSKITKLSTFVEAAVKDGKVVKRGDRFLLPSK